jgi:hypothetical protein
MTILCEIDIKEKEKFGSLILYTTDKSKKGKGHPCTGTAALYKTYGP